MNTRKIINDPVYGFINYPYDIIYELINHPAVQRLRRIKQLGLTSYVYPGAEHTRFHHTLGAIHLMTRALETLRYKGIEITEEEAIAATIGIAMHDIGHAPFSHAMEYKIVDVSHECMSLLIMEMLNEEFDGRLSLAIKIYKNEYPKKFLYQLISSQLDVDRMDYLNRDSYFTGVAEGVIGFERIIKMMHVIDGEIVIEEKGQFSIEKYLMARRIMYWQVYLHKTTIAAEQMLIKIVNSFKARYEDLAESRWISSALQYFLSKTWTEEEILQNKSEVLRNYLALDDHDIYNMLKLFKNSQDEMLQYFSQSLLDRKLMKIKMQEKPFSVEEKQKIYKEVEKLSISNKINVSDLVLEGQESNLSYNTKGETIKVLKKSGEVVSITDIASNLIDTSVIIRYFLCFPNLN